LTASWGRAALLVATSLDAIRIRLPDLGTVLATVVLAPHWVVAFRIGAPQQIFVFFSLELAWKLCCVLATRPGNTTLFVGTALVLEVVRVHLLVVLGAFTITISITTAGIVCTEARFTALLIGAPCCCLPVGSIQGFPHGRRTAAVRRAHHFITTLLVTPSSLGVLLGVNVGLVNPFRGTAAAVLLAEPGFAALLISTAQPLFSRLLPQLWAAAIVSLAGQFLTAKFAGKASTLFAIGQQGAEIRPLCLWTAGEILAI